MSNLEVEDKKENLANELAGLFSMIKTGKYSKTKEADNEVTKIIIKSKEGDVLSFYKDMEPIVLSEIRDFDSIKYPKNQAMLICCMSYLMGKIAITNFEIIREFAFNTIQNSNGYVRVAAEKLFWEILFYFDTIIEYNSIFVDTKKPTDKEIKDAEVRYMKIVKELEELIEKNDTQEETDYVENMKSSIAKNLNNIWGRYTSCDLYRKILEKLRPISLDILSLRMSTSIKLESLLKRSKSEYDLDDIKRIIFDEDDPDDLMRLISIFDTGEKGAPSFDEAMDAIDDAWNCFPHGSLEGACPIEEMSEL